MNLLRRELKANLKSLLIWSGVMAALIYMGMIKYSAFAKTGVAVNEFFDQLPEPLMMILGIVPGTDLTTVAVFYSIFFLYFLLLAAVHATMLGTIIIAKEERDKTADFLFVKPIKRHHAIMIKVIAAMINITILNLVTFIVSIISTAPHTEESSLTQQILFVMIGLYLVQFIFLGLGLLFGAIAKRSKEGTAIGAAIILGTFLLKVLIDLRQNLDGLDFLTPFRYFKPNELMFENHVDLVYTILAVAIFILTTGLTFYFFKKRDLRN